MPHTVRANTAQAPRIAALGASALHPDLDTIARRAASTVPFVRQQLSEAEVIKPAKMLSTSGAVNHPRAPAAVCVKKEEPTTP